MPLEIQGQLILNEIKQDRYGNHFLKMEMYDDDDNFVSSVSITPEVATDIIKHLQEQFNL